MDNRQRKRNMQEEVEKIPYDELYFLRYTTNSSTTENVIKITLYQTELENRRRNVDILNNIFLPLNDAKDNPVPKENQVYMRQGKGINLFRIYGIDVMKRLLQDSGAIGQKCVVSIPRLHSAAQTLPRIHSAAPSSSKN